MSTGSWWVYILQCGDGSLYTGITTDVAARVRKHQAGTGARYTRSRGVVAVVYRECQPTRGDALRREAALKRLDRAAKLRLIVSVSIDNNIPVL